MKLTICTSETRLRQQPQKVRFAQEGSQKLAYRTKTQKYDKIKQYKNDKNSPIQTKARRAYRTRGVTKKTLGAKLSPLRCNLFFLIFADQIFGSAPEGALHTQREASKKLCLFRFCAPKGGQNYGKHRGSIVSGKALSGAESKAQPDGPCNSPKARSGAEMKMSHQAWDLLQPGAPFKHVKKSRVFGTFW